MGFDPNAAPVPDVAGGDLAAPPAAADPAPVGPPPDAPAAPPADAATDPSSSSSSPDTEAHQAAAEHVATAGPVVWGDQGEVVQMAAKLLGRATGQSFADHNGVVPSMWNAALSDACKGFQEARGLVVALPGCVDSETWRALEAAAQTGSVGA